MQAAGPDSLGRLLVSRMGAVWEAGKPITVQDLLETLIPYRHARSALGLTMKGEYDLGILHLLRSGEHLLVEADLAQAVEQELAAPEPDLGFLSELAASRVEVRPDAWAHWSEGNAASDTTARSTTPRDTTSRIAPPSTAPRTAAPPRTTPELEGRPTPVDRPAGTTDRPSRRPSTPAPEIEGAATPSERCRRCQRILPVRSGLEFCPFCGAGQADPTCAECSERLERGWAYCPRCGKAMKT